MDAARDEYIKYGLALVRKCPDDKEVIFTIFSCMPGNVGGRIYNFLSRDLKENKVLALCAISRGYTGSICDKFKTDRDVIFAYCS